MLVFYMQFKDAIADLKTPERSDKYLLSWLKGREVVHCVLRVQLISSKCIFCLPYQTTAMFWLQWTLSYQNSGIDE